MKWSTAALSLMLGGALQAIASTTDTVTNPNHNMRGGMLSLHSKALGVTGTLDTRLLEQQVETDTKLIPSDDTFLFGTSVSISGDTIVATSDNDSSDVDATSSVYVFERSGGAWTQQAKLTVDDVFDWSDESVAISGNTLVVGWPNGNSMDDRGEVYVFERSGGAWSKKVKLVPNDDGGAYRFGKSVSISGDTIVVGSSSAVFVFERSEGAWTQQAQLLTDIAGFADGGVSISGDTLVIGSPFDDVRGWHSGLVYVFERNGGAWTKQAKLVPDDGVEGDEFGMSVSISGDTIVVGSPGDDINMDNYDGGSAYVFERSGGIWTQQAKLTAIFDTTPSFLESLYISSDYFGTSVSISGDKVVVGSPYSDNGGSAFVFERSGGAWTQKAKFTADNGFEGDEFGASVSISGNTVVAGSPKSGAKGSVYVKNLSYGTDATSGSVRTSSASVSDASLGTVALTTFALTLNTIFAVAVAADSSAL